MRARPFCGSPFTFFCCRCAARYNAAWRTSRLRVTPQAFTFKINSQSDQRWRNDMNPMNTQTNKPTKRIPHVRMLFTLAVLCLIQSLIANVAFAQVNYSTFSYPGAGPEDRQGPTGVRGAGGQDVYVTGIWNDCSSHGLLYVGPLSGGGNSGSWTVLHYPSSRGITVAGTSLYGPDGLPPGNVRLVGSYTKTETGHMNHGLLYEGPPDNSCSVVCWQTIDFPIAGLRNTIAHSTMGGLVVGNYNTDSDPGSAFVYDIEAGTWTELPKGPFWAKT